MAPTMLRQSLPSLPAPALRRPAVLLHTSAVQARPTAAAAGLKRPDIPGCKAKDLGGSEDPAQAATTAGASPAGDQALGRISEEVGSRRSSFVRHALIRPCSLIKKCKGSLKLQPLVPHEGSLSREATRHVQMSCMH